MSDTRKRAIEWALFDLPVGELITYSEVADRVLRAIGPRRWWWSKSRAPYGAIRARSDDQIIERIQVAETLENVAGRASLGVTTDSDVDELLAIAKRLRTNA